MIINRHKLWKQKIIYMKTFSFCSKKVDFYKKKDKGKLDFFNKIQVLPKSDPLSHKSDEVNTY